MDIFEFFRDKNNKYGDISLGNLRWVLCFNSQIMAEVKFFGKRGLTFDDFSLSKVKTWGFYLSYIYIKQIQSLRAFDLQKKTLEEISLSRTNCDTFWPLPLFLKTVNWIIKKGWSLKETLMHCLTSGNIRRPTGLLCMLNNIDMF